MAASGGNSPTLPSARSSQPHRGGLASRPWGIPSRRKAAGQTSAGGRGRALMGGSDRKGQQQTPARPAPPALDRGPFAQACTARLERGGIRPRASSPWNPAGVRQPSQCRRERADRRAHLRCGHPQQFDPRRQARDPRQDLEGVRRERTASWSRIARGQESNRRQRRADK
jgi:hypothetical protein